MIETILIILGMFLFPFFYLIVLKKYNWKETQNYLFPKITDYKKEIIGTIQLFILLLLFSMVISVGINLGENVTGEKINDLDKVKEAVKEDIAQGWIYFTIIIIFGLFVEELLFRAFLVPKIGMILSTIMFTIAHFSYGSITEIIGVFILGLILAWWYKNNKSLIQNYFGHVLYDAIAIGIYFLI